MVINRVFLQTTNQVFLDAYIADPMKAFTRKAILVIPGGAYRSVCADREGEPIAMAFLPYGYNAFVLHYTVDGIHGFPTQVIETALAIKHLKDHSEEYNIDPDSIFVVGFSAGGHLAACSGTMWKLDAVQEALCMPYDYIKPKGVMLIYPVISSQFHLISFKHLLTSQDPTPEQLALVSVENHVDKDSAPAFILHTANDECVDVHNALTIAAAYSNAGVPFELHIFPNAPHGIALANSITSWGNPYWENTAIAEWIRMATTWANTL